MLDPEVLENLRCNACHNFLSVLPIHSYGGEQNICGRCPVDEAFFPQQAILYETVIKNMFFPCQYEMRGCPEKTTPECMRQHEATCSFRHFQCPSIFPECKFLGGLDEIHTHFLDEHPGYVLKDVELDIINVYEKNYVYFDENDTFTISMKCDKFEGNLYAQVKYLNDEKAAENFSFALQFSTKHNTFFNTLGKVTFSELKELDLSKPHQIIEIEDLKYNLNNPALIMCNIKINRDKLTPEKKRSESDDSLLRLLECPVCFLYMIPPILQCTRGHSFCQNCHRQLDICPVCRQSMSNSQNFGLESLTMKIEYPCKNQQFDCPYSGLVTDIRIHEENCIFGPFSCVFKDCAWKASFANFLGHVKKCHHDDYLDVNTVTHVVVPYSNERETYIINKFGSLFRVLFEKHEDMYRWSLQLIGPDTDPSKYILELDFKSPDGQEQIFYKKMCNYPVKDEDAFSITESYVELTSRALDDMIEDELLIYYCNVALA